MFSSVCAAEGLPTISDMFEIFLQAGCAPAYAVELKTLQSLSISQRRLYAALVDFSFAKGQVGEGNGSEVDLFSRFRKDLDLGTNADAFSLRCALDDANENVLGLLGSAMEYAYEEGRLSFSSSEKFSKHGHHGH